MIKQSLESKLQDEERFLNHELQVAEIVCEEKLLRGVLMPPTTMEKIGENNQD